MFIYVNLVYYMVPNFVEKRKNCKIIISIFDRSIIFGKHYAI